MPRAAVTRVSLALNPGYAFRAYAAPGIPSPGHTQPRAYAVPGVRGRGQSPVDADGSAYEGGIAGCTQP